MRNKILEIKKLSKTFTNKSEPLQVLNNIDLDIYEDEIIAIVGTSGCGKSTLLNLITGLDSDYEGEIKYNFDKNNIGYMFQEPALFPWLSIKNNALISSKIKKIDREYYIDNLLKKYNLYEFKDKFPNSLSGGMKQRVSLIRTLSLKPKLLLLDEPFAALDYQTRLKITDDVHNLIKENKITTIIITHDISEAVSFADRVVVLSKRPAPIKNIYEIKLNNKSNPTNNRKDELFSNYYEIIGKDLDIF